MSMNSKTCRESAPTSRYPPTQMNLTRTATNATQSSLLRVGRWRISKASMGCSQKTCRSNTMEQRVIKWGRTKACRDRSRLSNSWARRSSTWLARTSSPWRIRSSASRSSVQKTWSRLSPPLASSQLHTSKVVRARTTGVRMCSIYTAKSPNNNRTWGRYLQLR